MISPASTSPLSLELRVQATAEGMDTVHEGMNRFWTRLSQERAVEPRWCDAFTLAVAEIAANIIVHAHSPGGPGSHFTITLRCRPDRLVGRFVDRGESYLVGNPPPPMPRVDVAFDELSESGRGLPLVHATTDRFEYSRSPAGENIWTIEKRFPT